MTVNLPAGWRDNPQIAEATLNLLRKKSAASSTVAHYGTPGDLARALDPDTKQTPALDIIDRTLVDIAEGRVKRAIISMPPQEGKSERTTHYGALWMLHRNPALRIGIVSYGERIARRFSMKIRNDILVFNGARGSRDLKLRLQRDSKAAGEWQLAWPEQGSMYATGVGGALTGQPLDMLFIDDPVKDFAAAESPFQSEAAWDWWDAVARPRLAPGAPVILIQTRWHELDLAGRLIAKQQADEEAGVNAVDVDYDKWTIINIPAQADHDPSKGETDVLGREPGEFMLSARGRTQAQWEATKLATGSRTWNALYQGRPSPDAGNILQRPWWRWYTTPLWSSTVDARAYTVEGGYDELLCSWDMTFKDTKGTDFVVGQLWMRRGANVFLLDQVRARLGFTETLAAFEAMYARWPQLRVALVEDKANGPAVISALRKKIPGIVPINPTDSKQARASAIAPMVEAGNVHLPAPDIALFNQSDNNPESLVDEASAFPNAAHDDQVDALTQALHRFFIAGAGASSWIESIRKQTAGVTPTVQPPATAPAPEPDLDASAPEQPIIDPHIAARAEQLRAMFR